MMKSKYAIRLYELMCEKMMDQRPHDRVAISIQLDLDEIRAVTGTNKKKSYDQVGHLKQKILLPALQDIENATRLKGDLQEYTGWKIIVNNVKQGRKIVGFNLEIWDRNGYEIIEKCKREGTIPPMPKYDDDGPRQMSLFDYME